MPKRQKQSVSLTKEVPAISEHETRLRQAYRSVQQYLIGLTRFLRLPEKHPPREKTKSSMRPMRRVKSHKELVALFEQCEDWHKRPAASGHVTFINSVTSMKVCAIPHAGELKPGVKQNLLQQIQKHLNILCNDIFMYKTNNWRKDPDYKQAVANDLKRLAALQKRSKSALPKVSTGLLARRCRR